MERGRRIAKRGVKKKKHEKEREIEEMRSRWEKETDKQDKTGR